MIDFTIDENRREFAYTIAAVAEYLGDPYPMLIGGERVTKTETFESVNPSSPTEVLARFPVATDDDVARAMAAAESAFEAWRHEAAPMRNAILHRAAEIVKRRRLELAAWCCFEAGLTWREADAEASAATGVFDESTFDAAAGVRVVRTTYRSPLALTAAAITAALGTGNTVVVRPDPRAVTIAWKLTEAFVDAGLPPGTLNFVPGDREPDDLVAPLEPFAINAISEVDDVLAAAFAHAGQRHPNIVHAVVRPDLFDEVAQRAQAAAAALLNGPAIDFQTDVGPVIDADAARRAREFLGVDGDDWFVPPTVLVDRPAVATPIPGPILTLERADGA